VSRTRKGTKGPGYEYWGRQGPRTILDPGRYSKRRTHKYERRKSAKELETLADGNPPPWYFRFSTSWT